MKDGWNEVTANTNNASSARRFRSLQKDAEKWVHDYICMRYSADGNPHHSSCFYDVRGTLYTKAKAYLALSQKYNFEVRLR